MPVPPGVTMIPVRITPPDGVSSVGLRVRLTPTIALTSETTGQSLASAVSVPARGIAGVAAPATDQAGWLTVENQPLKGWSYLLVVEGTVAGVWFSSTRLIRPTIVGGALELDLMTTPGGSVELPERLSKAALDEHYAPLFQPLTPYLAGALAILPAPANAIGTRIANGTSRAAFDSTEQALWSVAVSGGGSGYDGGQL